MPNIILIENDYPNATSLLKVINYVLRSDMVGGYAVYPPEAFRQMQMVKKAFHKEKGVQLKHFIVSFSLAESYRMSVNDVLSLGFQIGRLFREYQLLYAVHLDTYHMHLHVVMNTVSFVDGHKYSGGLFNFWRLKSELQSRFPRSNVELYRSLPQSETNRYSFSEDDYLLRIN